MDKGKFTLVQQYVIDSLINNEHLVIDDILSAISTACTEEKCNEILSVLINKVKNLKIDKASLEVEDLTTQSIVEVSLEIPKSFYEIDKRKANRVNLIRTITRNTSLGLQISKEFADSVRRVVILKYSEVIELRKALKEYGIKVNVVQQLT